MKALLTCKRCELSEYWHNKREECFQQPDDYNRTGKFGFRAEWTNAETGKDANSGEYGPILFEVQQALTTYNEAPADFKPGKTMKRVYRTNETTIKQPRKPRAKSQTIYLVGELWFTDRKEAREFARELESDVLRASSTFAKVA